MTTQQEVHNVDLVPLTALYERGDYTQALQQIEARGLLRLLDEPADGPEAAGEALLIGNIYRALARYTEAEPYYLHALAGLARALGTDHPGYARGLIELGLLYQLMAQYEKARLLFEKARLIHENAAEPDPLGHARGLQMLADLHDLLGERRQAKACLSQARALMERANASPEAMAELLSKEAWGLCLLEGRQAAIARARQALAIYRKHKGERHPGTVQASYQLGRLLISVCQLEEAASLLEGVAALRRERLGENHPLHATAVESLALLHLVRGETEEAEKLARQALAQTAAALGERHLDVAARLCVLGQILMAANQFSASLDSYERAGRIVREVLGNEHPRAADIQVELAEIRAEMGERREAAGQIRTALDVLDRSPLEARSEQTIAYLTLARLQADAGELEEASASVRRAASLAESLADSPQYGKALLLEARLRAERGRVTEADNLLTRAEQILADLPSHHPLQMQAVITRAEAARLAGDGAGAVRLIRAMVDRVEQRHGGHSPYLLAALLVLAEQLHLVGEFAESERIYERVLDLQRRREPDHPDVATTLSRLARLHQSRGNPAAAEVRFRQALDIRRNCLGDRHPDTAEIWNDLGWLLYQVGNLQYAAPLFQSALEVRRECLGANHPDTLDSLHGLALTALARGAPAEAADLVEQALSLIRDDHPQKLPLMHTLARASHAQGHRARALTLLRDILVAQEKSFGANYPGLLPILTDLVQVQAGLGDHLAARELLERIRALRAHSPIPDPLGQAHLLVDLSESHQQLNDLTRAGELSRQALALARRHLKRDDPQLVGFLRHFAHSCQVRRALSASRRHLREAQRIIRKTGGDHHPFLAGLDADLAGVEISQGKPRRATPHYARAADLLQTVLGEDHPDHAAARRTLGQHLQAVGELVRAEEALRRHLHIVLRAPGGEHPTVALAYQALAELKRQRGDWTEATVLCRRALDLIRRAEPPLDALHAALLHGLALLCRQQGQWKEAANLLRSALEIDRSAIGLEGAGHLASLYELALIEAAGGENAKAVECIRQALALQDERTAVFAYLPPGTARDALLAWPWTLTESLLTLALRLPDAAEAALESVLRWKGLGIADLVPLDRAAVRRRHPRQARELDRLFDLSVQIARRLVQGAGPEGLPMHYDLLGRWRQERQGLEERLAPVVPVLARLRALRAVDLPGLRRALPAGAAFVELVRFRPRHFAEAGSGREGLLPPRYLSFVFYTGEERVMMYDLGSAADLESHSGAETLRRALALHLVGRQPLFLAAEGRLRRAARAQLARSRKLVRMLASGREMISPLLAPPAGWMAWLHGLPLFACTSPAVGP